ncbi:hypothetical protein N0V88_003577 [Collariella sp. IMI 366227]|nr:hypothetical protein N0V88_003577 [Collariella sp. IMI 366227]
MTDNNWGPTSATVSAFKAQAVGAFGTTEMQNALLGGTNDDVEATSGTAKGWSKGTPYDYAAYGSGSAVLWDGNAATYEWDGEQGDIGPEFPALEFELFGPPGQRAKQGLDFSKIAEIALFQEGPARVEPITTFKDAGLHPAMLKNVELAGYEAPTPIQRYCLPAIHMGYDVIGVAQTGSGKTAAYLIPILNKLCGKVKKLAAPRPNAATASGYRAEPLVVIVVPTRELAVQVFNEARKFCYRTMLRPTVVYGGGGMRDQEAQLQKGCDIIIGTPGRLVHFINKPDHLTLRRVRYVVIDEADEMLDQDWKDDLDKIMTGGEQEEGNINYMLFSATFPKLARDLAKTHLAETHVRLRVGRAGSTHENIKQTLVYVDHSMKKQALFDLLKSLPPTRTIIFVNSKRTAEEVDDWLYNQGMPCTSMHGDRNQKEREASMRGFRSGDWPILIATGVSARGIDVRNVMHVINYDLPSMDHGGIEEYTHRIGRTGRIGHRGLATSFYSDRDEAIASVLTRTLIETSQEIPDFLQSYVPEGASAGNLKFEADSDFEDDAAGVDASTGGGDGGWGADTAGAAATDGAADGWGAGDAGTGGGWGAETSSAAPVEARSGW